MQIHRRRAPLRLEMETSMKKFFQVLIPLLMVVLILASLWWYLFRYDRAFTRDVLLYQARYNDLHGNTRLSAWFYDMAYDFSGRDENVAIELANQYKSSGNYTKAEVTLSRAIHSGGTLELYIALCETYVEQDKILDAGALLDGISDPAIAAQLESMRPSAPEADRAPGFFTQYIDVSLSSSGGTIYCTTDGSVPSVADAPYDGAISLPAGETVITAVSVGDDGLVSPISTLGYTVGGVIEPAIFMDPSVEQLVRRTLEFSDNQIVYTDDMWGITEFVYPEDAMSLDDLALMPYLSSLAVHNMSLSNLDAISSLGTLETLDLSGCSFPASALETIAALPSLRNLNLSDCSLSTVSGLENAGNLRSLDISSNAIRNLTPLSGLTGLTELKMGHNALVDLEQLSGLTELKTLDVSYNSLVSLRPLSTLTKLSALDASYNQLSSISGLETMNMLETLALDHNQISDLGSISGAVSLTNLTVSNNLLEDISCLANLSKLEIFDFSYNSVTALPAWPQSAGLRTISGSHNALESLNPLSGMAQLTFVNMDYNNLTSVDALANCLNLVRVNVYGNEIDDVSSLTSQNVLVNYDPT